MAVRNQHAITTRQNFGETLINNAGHPVGNVGQLLTRRIARWYQMLPDHPIWIIKFYADLFSGSTLPRTVIPFQQIIGIAVWLQSGKFSGTPTAS